MHVLHCIHSTDGGGAERQLRILHAALGALAVESTILCVDDSGGAAALREGGVITATAADSHPVRLYRCIREAIRERRPDVMHVWLPPAVTVPALIAARVAGVPSVFAYRNRMWFRDWKRVSEFAVALLACQGVASNNPIAQNARQYRWLFRRRRGMVIANAVDLPAALRDCIRPVDDGPLRLIFAGRTTHQKNWRCLLGALERLPDDLEWNLRICGEGEDRAALEAATARAGLSSRVMLRGFCRDLVAEMRASDLLIAPSWYEGSPNVLMEALYLGLPALVSDIPAHRDVLGSARQRFFFRPDDPGALAAALEAVVRDRVELRRIKAEQQAVEFVRPEDAARAYKTYYEAVIGLAH